MLSGTGSPVKLSGCRATDAGIDGNGDLPDMARMGGNMSLKYVAGHGILPGSCNEFQFQKTWPEIRYECRDFTKCQRRAPGSGVCAEYHLRLSGYLYLSLTGQCLCQCRYREYGAVRFPSGESVMGGRCKISAGDIFLCAWGFCRRICPSETAGGKTDRLASVRADTGNCMSCACDLRSLR